jgi:tricorn protease-like protein
MAEEADYYYPEQFHSIITVIFLTIGKIEALQSYVPLVRLFARLQTRTSTFIPTQRSDGRYAAFLTALKSINQSEDRNLANFLFQELIQPEEISSAKKNNEPDFRETQKAALEVLSVIGDVVDIMRLEQIVETKNFESSHDDMGNVYRETIVKIKQRLQAKN